MGSYSKLLIVYLCPYLLVSGTMTSHLTRARRNLAYIPDDLVFPEVEHGRSGT